MHLISNGITCNCILTNCLIFMKIKPTLRAADVLNGSTPMDFSKKKIIVADLDDTLTESKQPLTSDLIRILDILLKYRMFAVITGASLTRMQEQVMSVMAGSRHLSNLIILPACATKYYKFENGKWTKVYEEDLTEEEKKRIYVAFESMFSELNYKHPQKIYGDLFEDKGSQITFSALGQKSPLEAKKGWDSDNKRRLEMKNILAKYIPEFEINLGGNTSIDVTKKGINKAYGIRKLEEKLGIRVDEMVFIGDKLMKGGNDYPVRTTGVDSIQVSDPEEGKLILKLIVERLRG